MPVWLRPLAYVSPLTYSTDLIRSSFGERAYFPLVVDGLVVVAFGAAFLLLARKLHARLLARGL